MIMHRVIAPLLITVSCLATSIQAHAASNGFAGQQSSGNIRISLTKTESIAVKGISDIALSADSSSKSGQSHDFCIFSSNKLYGVSVSSRHGGGGNYQLSDGEKMIGYNVSLGDGKNFVDPGEMNSFGNGATQPCDKENNASLRINIKPESLALAKAGVFSDTLTIVFQPI